MICVAAVAYLVCSALTLDTPVRRGESVVTSVANAPIEPEVNLDEISLAFDVSFLIGLSIDEVRERLGSPEGTDVEPTELQMELGFDEWFNQWPHASEQQVASPNYGGPMFLLITFNPQNREVVDFFLPGMNKAAVMKQGGLQYGDSRYTIVPVPSVKDRRRITGIKIVPASSIPF